MLVMSEELEKSTSYSILSLFFSFMKLDDLLGIFF